MPLRWYWSCLTYSAPPPQTPWATSVSSQHICSRSTVMQCKHMQLGCISLTLFVSKKTQLAGLVQGCQQARRYTCAWNAHWLIIATSAPLCNCPKASARPILIMLQHIANAGECVPRSSCLTTPAIAQAYRHHMQPCARRHMPFTLTPLAPVIALVHADTLCLQHAHFKTPLD